MHKKFELYALYILQSPVLLTLSIKDKDQYLII